MKNRYRMTVLLGALMLAALATGCIKNDIPFEIVPGNITSMEVRGAESVSLENSSRTIELVLADTVDLRHVLLEDFRITPDARIIDNVTHQELDTLDSYYLDLTQGSAEYAIPSPEQKPYTFTVITYQDYIWTLKATQNIERVFTLADGQQIGEAKFSATGYSVIAYVPETVPLTGIDIQELKLGPSNATMAWVKADGTVVEDVDVKTIHDFTLPQHFIVKFFDITQEWTVSVEQSAQYVTEMSVNPWAKFAYLSAQGLTSAGTCGFQIRKAGAGDDAWTDVAATVDGVQFSGKATGLTPSTQYEARGVIGTNYGDVVAFTTDDTPAIPNLNLDQWTLAKTTWYPNSDAANSYWATGNKGVTLAGKASISVPTDVTVDGTGEAAQLTTIGGVPFAQIAAGNIFIGDFVISSLPTNLPAMRKCPRFGRPYTGRPTSLTGWYKYTSATIDIAADKNLPDLIAKIGQPDECHIYISLENWGGASERPLGTSATSLSDPSVIGYGEFHTSQTIGEYTPFTIDIEYKNTTDKPTHIVLVATSSRWGGDFCGGTGSVLLVDDMEISFD
ncbi:MAG: PCMD domain-containing protein [Rikenellaceae bacterium]|nr:PCMD domain-containing protein [Rikenellaceae bacterium]